MKNEQKYYELLDLTEKIKEIINEECEDKYDVFIILDLIFLKLLGRSVLNNKEKFKLLNTLMSKILEDEQ